MSFVFNFFAERPRKERVIGIHAPFCYDIANSLPYQNSNGPFNPMPRKRTLYVIFCALVFLVFAVYAARGPIGSTFFEWYLKGYCRACLSSKLIYEDLHHENGQWVFQKPVLATKKRLEDGGYRIQANRATIRVSPTWWKPALNFSLEVDNPVVDIGKEAEGFRKLLQQPSQTFHLFDIHTKINVPQGTILVHDFANDLLVPIPLFFHLNLVCKESRKGCLSFWVDEQDSDNTDFYVSFTENDKHEPQIRFELQNVCCFTAHQILKGILPDYQSFEISSGSINGDLIFSFPKEAPHYIDGQISLNELVLHHKDFDLDLAIPEAVLTLTPNATENEGKAYIQTVGKLDIPPSKLELKKEEKPFWTLYEANGTASFIQKDYGNFSLSGIVEDHGKVRHLTIEGIGAFSDTEQTTYALDMQLKGEHTQNDTSFHFSARKLSDQWSFGEVELLGWGVEELDLVQHLVKKQYPKWSNVQLFQGNIDAAMYMYFKGFHLSEVNVERLAAHDMAFSYDPWGLYASVEDAQGSLSFDLLAENPIKTLDADLKVRQGTLNLEAIGLDNVSWQLSNVDTYLTIDKGIFQKSLLTGTIAGLKGEIEVDGTSGSSLMFFNFRGDVDDFAQALPESIRTGLKKEFIGDHLTIVAQATGSSDGLTFDCEASIAAEDKPTDDIRFGFTVGRSSESLWRRWPPPSLAVDYYLNGGLEAVQALTPPIAQPLFSGYRYLISQNLGFSGFTLKDGWFQAEQLPLIKYLSPFLFSEDQMELRGIGDFSGTFDQQKILMHYDAQDMVLENDNFAIEIKSLSEEGATVPHKLVARFIYDLNTHKTFNSFPIRKGTYFEKNTGLLYTEIDANLSMDGSIAYFDDLTTFSNGIYFAGSAIVDWSMPGEGVFKVGLNAREMHGKVSQLQHLLSHVNKSIVFLKIPLEGNVGLQKGGGRLNFAFNPEGYELEAVVQGVMSDGTMSDQNTDLSLREMNLNFDYDYKANKLAFTDIQGTLLVGKPNHVEEYAIAGEGIHFTNYSKDEADFDIWIGNKARDILRVAGKTHSEIDDNGNSSVNFLFNRYITHFGDIYPTEIKLSLKDWSQLENLQLKCDFQLHNLLSDLKKFSRTGLFFLSRGLLKELNNIHSAKGEIKADLNYDPERSIFHYSIEGQELAIDKRQFSNFLLSGTKKGSLWSVNQLQLDNVSLAFDVMKEGSLWNINFLGAKLGDYLLVGMEGQYSEADSQLEARINFFETDLSQLSNWPGSPLQIDFISGLIKGSGTLNARFDKTLPYGMHLNLSLNSAISNASFKNIFFDDIKNLLIRYDTMRGLKIRNAELGIKSPEDTVIAKLSLQEADWNTSKNELVIDSLRFDIPASNLSATVKLLQDHFPDKISERFAETIRSSRKQGSLQGVLRYSLAEPYSSLRVHLADGIYHFKGKDHDLSGFVVDYDPYALKVFTEYRYQKHRLRLDAYSSAKNLDDGEILLSDFADPTAHPLKVHWKIHPQTGFYIQKISGELSGMTFNLLHDPNKQLSDEYMHLVGKMDINFRRAVSMMDDDIAAKIANLELGEGYALNGYWTIQKGSPKSLADSLFFQGELTGNDFEFFGYRFFGLASQFTYSPEVAYMRNLTATDASGNMQIGQIDFLNMGYGLWQAAIPLISVSGFRPSFLNSAKAMPSSAKSLVIRSLDIKDVKGILGDRNSFTGKGELAFVNPEKKNFQNSILAIPAELLTRIGLDLSVLTPVRGSVFFDIKEGKAILDRFKDVYSKGRLSKFYLANNGFKSYVDFDGNLNLQVRMKQYNIIFKLAELFTFKVQGTLRKPSYALMTQQKQDAFAAPHKEN